MTTPFEMLRLGDALFGPAMLTLLSIVAGGASDLVGRSPVERLYNYRKVPDNSTNVRAQCAANCMTYEKSSVQAGRQPYKCDQACERCRLAACKNFIDLTKCRQRCQELQPKGNITALQKCYKGCEFVDGLRKKSMKKDVDSLPEYPLGGPTLLLWKGQRLNGSQWLMWIASDIPFIHLDDDPMLQKQMSLATVFKVRRLEMTALPNGAIHESFKESVLTTAPMVPVSKLFQQDSRRPKPGSCYSFDVAAVSRFGTRGYIRTTNFYSPYMLGVYDVRPRTECWQRICMAPLSVTSKQAGNGLTVKIEEAGREFNRLKMMTSIVVTWTTSLPPKSAPNRCFLLKVTTLDVERERCGNDKEVVLMRDAHFFKVGDLYELCNYTFEITMLPLNIRDRFSMVIPPSDDARKARNIKMFNVSFQPQPVWTNRNHTKRSTVKFKAAVSWQQPADRQGLTGFCFTVIDSLRGFITNTIPAAIACRENKIPVKKHPAAVYTVQLQKLIPNHEYIIEVAATFEGQLNAEQSQVILKTPNIQPENLELASLTGTTATVKWNLERCEHLSKQGGRLHVVLARIGKDLPERQRKTRASDRGYRRRFDRLINVNSQQEKPAGAGETRIMPNWSKVQELVIQDRMNYRMVEIKLSRKENYLFIFHGLLPHTRYAVVVYGPAPTGLAGQPSNELVFSTSTGSLPTQPLVTASTQLSWYKTTRGSLVIMVCTIFLFVFIVLALVLVCRRRDRFVLYPTTRRSTRCTLKGVLHRRHGDVPSRPTTWFPHDANAIPQARTLERHLNNQSFSAQRCSYPGSTRLSEYNGDESAMAMSEASSEWTHTPNRTTWNSIDFDMTQGAMRLSAMSGASLQQAYQNHRVSTTSGTSSFGVRPNSSVVDNGPVRDASQKNNSLSSAEASEAQG